MTSIAKKTQLPEKGALPSENSSHIVTPKAQTSDWLEKIRSDSDSIAIHLTGSIPCHREEKGHIYKMKC